MPGDVPFEIFLAQLREQALAAQIQPSVFDTATRGVAPVQEVLDKQANQAEFNLSLADYMTRVLPKARVRKGRSLLRQNRALLMDIESEYGVEPEIVVAIWGIETDFGRLRGTFPLLPTLVTMAWRGRRAGFFCAEFIAALRLIQMGTVAPENMRGSWAGATGHGQFMPSSVLNFAVDHDGDGRADLWSDDPTDALASIANYLAKHGWIPGQPWGLEIALPDGFDFALAGADTVQPVSFWKDCGLRLQDGGTPANYGKASVLLPAGAEGPAFLVFRNFHVLARYNTATPYVLAVGLLSEFILGRRAPAPDWPEDPPLTRSQVRRVQEGLALAGYVPGAADGLIGPETTSALKQWQIARHLPADGYPSLSVLMALTGDPGTEG